MINILLMIFYVFLSVSGLILYKLGSNSSQIEVIAKEILSLKISFISIIGIFCYISSFIFFLILLSRNALSFLLPVITAIIYILVLIASVIILKEKVTLISLLGSLLIIIGVMLILFKEKL